MSNLELVLQLLVDGLALGCIYALIALGYTMVYGIVKLINFAHGEFYMVGAYAGLFTVAALKRRGLGLAEPWETVAVFLLAMLAAGLAAGVLAVIVERLAYRPLRRAPRISVLLTALGVSLFLQNAALKTFTPNTQHFDAGIVDRRYPRIAVPAGTVRAGSLFEREIFFVGESGDEYRLAGPEAPLDAEGLEWAGERGARTFHRYPMVAVRKKQMIIWGSVLGLTLGLHVLVRYTRTGKAMRAVSYDIEAAQLAGINVNRVIAFTFFVGAALAGAGGVLVGSYYGAAIKPTMGVMIGLKAFVAAVLGGIGSIYGAVLGGLALGMTENLANVSEHTAPYQDAIAFAVLVGVLVFMPRGFLGEKETERV